jgi:hypothetical protein
MLETAREETPHTGDAQGRLNQWREPGKDLTRRICVLHNRSPIQPLIEQDSYQGKATQVDICGVNAAGARNYSSRVPRWK